jgi:hypothetical protein
MTASPAQQMPVWDALFSETKKICDTDVLGIENRVTD